MTFSTRTMQPEDWSQVKHFTPDEFAHPDKMGYEFLVWLDAVRERADVPMTITSSYRAPAHNRRVGGASDSAHKDIPCNAVDIGMRPRPDDPNWNLTRFRIIEAAMALGCQRVGTYANGSIHLDRTEDQRPAPRMWRLVGNERKQ
jgi:uncharacterized protein YcbK (DUF882 family)